MTHSEPHISIAACRDGFNVILYGSVRNRVFGDFATCCDSPNMVRFQLGEPHASIGTCSEVPMGGYQP